MKLNAYEKARELLRAVKAQDGDAKVRLDAAGAKTIFALRYGEDGFACVDVSELAAKPQSEEWKWILQQLTAKKI